MKTNKHQVEDVDGYTDPEKGNTETVVAIALSAPSASKNSLRKQAAETACYKTL